MLYGNIGETSYFKPIIILILILPRLIQIGIPYYMC